MNHASTFTFSVAKTATFVTIITTTTAVRNYSKVVEWGLLTPSLRTRGCLCVCCLATGRSCEVMKQKHIPVSSLELTNNKSQMLPLHFIALLVLELSPVSRSIILVGIIRIRKILTRASRCTESNAFLIST